MSDHDPVREMAERVAKRICAVRDGDEPIPVDSVADAEPPIPDRKWIAVLVAEEVETFLAEREGERAGQVRQACKLLMEDDGFHEAMALLCPIAGLEFPAADVKVETRDLRAFFAEETP